MNENYPFFSLFLKPRPEFRNVCCRVLLTALDFKNQAPAVYAAVSIHTPPPTQVQIGDLEPHPQRSGDRRCNRFLVVLAHCDVLCPRLALIFGRSSYSDLGTSESASAMSPTC